MKRVKIKKPHDLVRLRRVALAAQGLLKAEPFGRGLAGARKAINHIGYVQIDTISVVERAHHHVLHSRVPKFDPAMTNLMLRERDIFEYWSHAAAFLPMADFRFSIPYKNAIKSGQTHWYKHRDKKLMAAMLDRIRIDGPLRSRDIESNTRKRAGWWDWKPAKKALEQLYMEGELMVSDREGFQKTYDLTERVLPSHVNTQPPSMEEFAAHIVDQQLRCHGFASLKGMIYQRRNTELREAVKTLVNQRLSEGSLQEVEICNGEIFIVEARILERPLPRLNNRLLILSPFDNSVIQRERLKALFQYDYKLECYVPEAKRQYGYFSLPLLFRDQFIGRMDCKAHRKNNHLEIKSIHWEPHNFDEDLVITAFVDSIAQFRQFQKCESVSLTQAQTGSINQQLRSAINSTER